MTDVDSIRPCDTCGANPPHGGERVYRGAGGDLRHGCDDDRACARAWSALSAAERRAVVADA